MIPDQLAQAADSQLAWLWSPASQVVLERELWLSVLKHQTLAGMPCPTGAYRDYQACLHTVSLGSIERRERRTKHDVKARIEEYNDLAGHEVIHRGLTSADVVDNVSLMKLQRSLRRLAALAYELERFEASRSFDDLAARLPFRGIKGPVGTQQDMLDLLGTLDRVDRLDRAVAADMGFSRVLGAVPQVYHRSIDLDVASTVAGAVAGLPGSTEWPERATGALMAGYLSMIASYCGDTWNEGDVSTSVTRRVALPHVMYLASIKLRATPNL